MNNIPQSYMAQHPLIFATEPVHPLHQSQSWLETALQNHAAIFSMDINGTEALIILQNHNFLAQLITEGMKIATQHLVNHMWMTNMLDPLAPNLAPGFVQAIQTLWNLPHHLSPYPNMQNLVQTPFFTPPEMINANPLLFPWRPMPVQQGRLVFVPMTTQGMLPMNSTPPPAMKPGEILRRRTSFTEISSLRNSALMVFPENEDKKYIHNCPLALKKCSFDLRPALNKDLAKHVVIMAPTMRTSQIPSEEDGEILNPQITHNPMTQQTSFMVWNTMGVNNDNFKINFKELIRNHNPCFVALLETKMDDHFNLKHEFNFDDYLEVPAQGRAGGMVLMWLTNMVNVTLKRMDDQELHAMIQVFPHHFSWCFSAIYASTDSYKRNVLSNNLENLSSCFPGPWLVVGDFNEILG
ncbi:uncharacterized protein LOC107006395 [Solanum pennellii]|uniref:Uncharacterized protein LOC107006395 n=1 Tax=Solanum pennellii TaxID=28526 RepID=A0ABM1FQZ1_SOLPN|nr:uncharacterized protein LOC107006395 [Solanum pennellii]